MKEKLNLYEVNKKTSITDVIVMLYKIENESRCFRFLSNRKAFIVGCLTACGFSFKENFASSFSNVNHVSHDNKIYRLPYSCSFGKWDSRYCFDIDISNYK